MPQQIEANIGRWCRFDAYEVGDGFIRPATGANPEFYDLWYDFRQARSDRSARIPPYGLLLDLLQNLEFRPVPGPGPLLALSPGSEERLLAWCTGNGLLGVLPQRVQLVTLAPRREPLEGREDHRVPTLNQFLRTNQGWIKTGRWRSGGHNASAENMPARQNEAIDSSQVPSDWPRPGVVIQDLRVPDYTVEPLSKTWGRFFPSVPEAAREGYAYPLPGTEAFWRIYAEPVEDFVAAATLLLSAIKFLGEVRISGDDLQHDRSEILARLDDLHRLLAPVGPAVTLTEDGTFRQEWRASTLLGAYTMMALLDLTEGRRPLICTTCGRLFVTKAHRGIYCSATCRQTAQKRRYRARLREIDEAN